MKVDIPYIACNFITYKINNVSIDYSGDKGVLNSDDIVLNDFIRGEHKVKVVEGDKRVPLDYTYDNGTVYINNPASDFK